MDLHAWITQQVERVAATAKEATPGPWQAEAHRIEGHGRTVIYPEVHPVAEIDSNGSGGVMGEADAVHIALHQPSAVLRRCEADRRTLARHRLDPGQAAFPAACKGCGVDGWGLPNIDNINDCPELLDLAHAHGITDDVLAELDHPQPPSTVDGLPADVGYEMRITHWPTTTSDVPAALRGPHWKP